MTLASLARTLFAITLLSLPAQAQQLDKVSFGTNWVAEAEHGGFYQAVADGTYAKYGLDVTIVPGETLSSCCACAGRTSSVMANSVRARDASVMQGLRGAENCTDHNRSRSSAKAG